MCGIAGVVSTQPDGELDSLARRMNGALTHRGPDGEGSYVCPDGRVALAHRRLAIIDLHTGDQPMTDHAARTSIVFNGEIYNYRELRAELRASEYPFVTQSDTEVILASYANWGFDMLRRLRGMFALALWDRTQRTLFLARDRFGKKPLYYAQRDGRLFFASELKSLKQVLNFDVDRVALAEYLVLGYVPNSRTIYRGVHRLPAGHVLAYSADGGIQMRRYWTLPLPDDSGSKRTVGDWEQAIASRLEEAVRLRMISDVPLGAFLSGGLDSSTIVAFCLQQVERPFHTFSIRPKDADSPDADAAKVVSGLLGTTHHEEVLDCPSPDELVGLFRHFDEPFADSSMIPTAAVSRAARREVTVALSGDGGDEVFGGYRMYRDYQNLSALAALPPVELAAPLLARLWPETAPAKVSLTVLGTGEAQRYLRLSAHVWRPTLDHLLGGSSELAAEAVGELTELFRFPTIQPEPGPVARAQWIDATRGYLAGDILHKVDMAGMAHSLEVRSPFLDHVLAEDLASLPAALRMRGVRGKLLLRRIAKRYLPEGIIERQKVGFTVPLGEWLSGRLQPLVSSYVSGTNSPLADYIDLEQARAFASPGTVYWARRQFSLLSLAVWAEGAQSGTA